MSLDPGRKETDKRLAEIERHLHEIYTQAYTELKRKTDDYFARFAEKDKKKRELVQAEKLSPQEYQKWRKGQMFVGEHWKRMKEQAAMDLYNVNKIANDYINDQLPDIYAMNYNFSAQDIENGVNHQISFEMANAQTVKDLSLAGDKMLYKSKKLDPQKDIPWNMRKINAAMLQGVLQGESIPKIAKRFMDVGVSNEVSAVRAARTMITAVENKARFESAKRAEKAGAIMGKIWISVSDERTRPWHAQAANDYAKPIPMDEPFIVNGEKMEEPGDPSASGSNTYNCRCSLGRKVLGFKSILPKDKQGKVKVRFV